MNHINLWLWFSVLQMVCLAMPTFPFGWAVKLLCTALSNRNVDYCPLEHIIKKMWCCPNSLSLCTRRRHWGGQCWKSDSTSTSSSSACLMGGPAIEPADKKCFVCTALKEPSVRVWVRGCERKRERHSSVCGRLGAWVGGTGRVCERRGFRAGPWP